ncbi:porin, partial [Lacihabitans sp. CS3-21]
VKYQYYNGGKKFEIDARKYLVKDLEIGIEYQIKNHFELVALYMISDRTFEDYAKPVNHQKGRTLRLQAQFNF